jgi:hypothetical protein
MERKRSPLISRNGRRWRKGVFQVHFWQLKEIAQILILFMAFVVSASAATQLQVQALLLPIAIVQRRVLGIQRSSVAAPICKFFLLRYVLDLRITHSRLQHQYLQRDNCGHATSSDYIDS